MDLQSAGPRRRAGRAWLAILWSLVMVNTVAGLSVNYCSSQNTGADSQGGQLLATSPSELPLLMACQSRTTTSLMELVKTLAKVLLLRSFKENSAGAPTMRPANKVRRVTATRIAQASRLRSAGIRARTSTHTSRSAAMSPARRGYQQRRPPHRLVAPFYRSPPSSVVSIRTKHCFPLERWLDSTSCASFS